MRVRHWNTSGGPLRLLGPGDWVEVARGVHHTAAVVGDETVVCLDAAKM